MAKRANGEGSIHLRKDGRYAASISLGKGKRKHFLDRNRAVVAAKMAEAQAQKNKGIPVVSNNLSVSHYLDLWLASIKASVRPKTYDSYDLNVRRLRPLIGRSRLSALKPVTIESAYASLQESGLSNRTVRQVHTVLHGALKKAVKLDLLGRNPADAVSVPRAERHEMKTLTETQVQRLFTTTKDDRFHALWVVLTTTGMRLGEAGGLQWQDVDLEKGSVTVRRSLQRQKDVGLVLVEPKTKSSQRKIHIPQGTVAALAAQRKRQLEERLQAGAEWQDLNLVFTRPDGRPIEPARISHDFHKALARAELPRIRVHDLRHTAATLLLSKGEHPKVVQEMLGHSTVTMTLDVYSHVVPTMHEAAAQKMQALFASG